MPAKLLRISQRLIIESEVLKAQNLEVGVFIGDDDNSSIAQCRAASSYPIIKESDTNHAAKGVKKQLYDIKKNYKDLTKDAILSLHRCFTYAVNQNKGNSKEMAAAILCIPYHATNDHSKCIENYKHRIVPDGFSDPQLTTDV